MAAADDQHDQDDKIKIVTDVYRPFLVQVLETRDVIEAMKGAFQGDEDVAFSELLDLCQSDMPRSKVTDRFLDILQRKADKRGLYQAFMHALEQSGNDSLRNHLEGTANIDTKKRTYYASFMRIYAERLEKMEPLTILDHVTGCLSKRDVEQIRATTKNHGNMAGASELLFRLDRKCENSFDLLTKGLRETDPKLAKELEGLKEFALGTREDPEESTSPHLGAGSADHDGETHETVDDDADSQGPYELELRSYQEEVATPALRGENILVVLPTGSGKTEVAISVIKRRFFTGHPIGSRLPKIGFIVDKVPLVKQQKDRCLKYLRGTCEIAGVSGEELTDVPLETVIEINDITVLTAQILVNAIVDDGTSLKLSSFALLVIDECHHCQKSDPYNVLMAMYRDMKLNTPKATRPQILAMTASPGVGHSKTLTEATDHIIGLCANLDCAIQVPTRDQPTGYGQKASEQEQEEILRNMKVVKGRTQSDPYIRDINIIMERIEQKILDSPVGRRLMETKMSSRRGEQGYEQDVVSLIKKIRENVEDSKDLSQLSQCALFLREYNNSLFVNRDVRTSDAIDYMEQYVETIEKTGTIGDTDLFLLNMFRDKLPSLRRIAQLHLNNNPVLNELGDCLKREYAKKPDSQTIIFTKTTDSAKALVKWLNEDKDLSKLNADFLIGVGSQGMTAADQNKKLQMLKQEKCRVIVATSVAEAGIDIRKLNLVFRYNYVTSDIGHMQTKGRIRDLEGKLYVILNFDLQIHSRELQNIIRVKLMLNTVQQIFKMNQQEFQQKMLKRQKEDQMERRLNKEIAERKKALKIEMAGVKLHCIKCFTEACTLDDIRAIKSQHHVVYSDSFQEKITTTDMKRQKTIDDFEFRQEIFCANPSCRQKWGTMVAYRGQRLPLVAVKNFTLKDRRGQKYLPRKWKDVPFQVQQVDVDELVQPQDMGWRQPADRSDDHNDDEGANDPSFPLIMSLD